MKQRNNRKLSTKERGEEEFFQKVLSSRLFFTPLGTETAKPRGPRRAEQEEGESKKQTDFGPRLFTFAYRYGRPKGRVQKFLVLITAEFSFLTVNRSATPTPARIAFLLLFNYEKN